MLFCSLLLFLKVIGGPLQLGAYAGSSLGPLTVRLTEQLMQPELLPPSLLNPSSLPVIPDYFVSQIFTPRLLYCHKLTQPSQKRTGDPSEPGSSLGFFLNLTFREFFLAAVYQLVQLVFFCSTC
ncbi:hypothetical protein DPEC_G00063460 [Dallia pectoralis]|uniref:Uncharacterized protein n=1 Tax=Dallia pectoralis TaxID=75939 RepID=A0ACC2H8Q7_DALPE|nr:hypothetical protein DPEC_G00063460 [Dallia pectoralis]